MSVALPQTPRGLLSDAQFNSVRDTVLDNNPGMEPELASRILVDALAFLAAATVRSVPLVPSRVVDEGWHALILHTVLYQELALRLGQFIHHIPERPDPANRSESSLTRTIDAISAAGYEVDMDLWRGPEDALVSVAASCQHSPDDGPIVIIPRPKPKIAE
ncbi:hypothetical protein OHU17_05280 [Streptomyces goshikiensis]|uniref:Uncharacterized protein n=1 Tax=Streptomyces goshikiensis TaxID=1942 RepID=A0ABZ1REV2_9ACTN|nr:hypothetical protein [Streptomyces goshikiensis]